MKIALMTNNYKPFMGGVPVSIERLYKELTNLGHEVTVFAPSYKNMKEEDRIFRYKSLFQKFYGGIVFPNPLDPAIEREFEKNRYDIIHVHHPMLIGSTAARLSRKYDIPLAFTYHTRYEQYLSYAGLIRRIEKDSRRSGIRGKLSGAVMKCINDGIVPRYIKSFSKKCDIVFVPTPGMKDYLEASCGVEAKKIRILPTGLESDEYEGNIEKVRQIRGRYIKSGDFLFVSVSRISHEKNIEFLINSVNALKKRTDMPFKLVCVGDGPKREEYKETCKKLNITEIEFVGKADNADIKNYCRAADAFLFASKSETQGIVVLEALAVGTPVIALRATGVSDIVMNGVNGVLAEENVEEFAEIVYSYMSGKIDNDMLSANALFTALEFKEDRVATKAVMAYEAAICERKSEERNHDGREVPYFAG